VKAKLAEKHLSTLTRISVDTDKDGVVWLSGTAPTKDAKDLAERLEKRWARPEAKRLFTRAPAELDDAKRLAQIDAVFVTVEPNGGSPKPSGKPFLFAYLKIDPNHP